MKEEDGERAEFVPHDREPHEEEELLVIDESSVFWNRFCGEAKMLANAASFTVPQAEGNEHSDAAAFLQQEPLLRKDVWAAKLSNRSRKEATATDVRQYAKQFLEAKLQERQSWKKHDVFDLAETGKVPAKSYVTGRWVLTGKRKADGSFVKCKRAMDS